MFRPGTDPTAPVNEALTIDGVTLLSADSSLPGERRGFLDDQTVAWLNTAMTGAAGHVVVAFHHPPSTLGMP